MKLSTRYFDENSEIIHCTCRAIAGKNEELKVRNYPLKLKKNCRKTEKILTKLST